jgi:hypothetical protein
MLDMLWKGHSRHGGGVNSRQQAQVEVAGALHMPAALTQWFTADFCAASRKDGNEPLDANEWQEVNESH